MHGGINAVYPEILVISIVILNKIRFASFHPWNFIKKYYEFTRTADSQEIILQHPEYGMPVLWRCHPLWLQN